ncbi:SMC-Scp complex subunit ScpB [Proteinivorax hydrogeniformans]|uniref:SMC-Scp complex subunit ScpB n=1 Tax=Proteinivorax hydrogeniformans TaxID=1826727 RepID=A0AAU8HQ97_9FIRM
MEQRGNIYDCLEALLFAAGEPVTIDQISEALELTQLQVNKLMEELIAQKEKSGGLMIKEVAGGYQMCSKPQYHKFIQKLFGETRHNNLTNATVETLAIIAYKQPITRAEIEDVRGVKVEKAISTLLARELIEEVGRKECTGRPILYGTTEEFLKQFGLGDLEDLPTPSDR